jgi:hypothetical protein
MFFCQSATQQVLSTPTEPKCLGIQLNISIFDFVQG